MIKDRITSEALGCARKLLGAPAEWRYEDLVVVANLLGERYPWEWAEVSRTALDTMLAEANAQNAAKRLALFCGPESKT